MYSGESCPEEYYINKYVDKHMKKYMNKLITRQRRM